MMHYRQLIILLAVKVYAKRCIDPFLCQILFECSNIYHVNIKVALMKVCQSQLRLQQEFVDLIIICDLVHQIWNDMKVPIVLQSRIPEKQIEVLMSVVFYFDNCIDYEINFNNRFYILITLLHLH